MNNIVEQAPPRVPLLDDLPPPNTRRWVVHRKAAVIAAVRAGKSTQLAMLSPRASPCERYHGDLTSSSPLRASAARTSLKAHVANSRFNRGSEVVFAISLRRNRADLRVRPLGSLLGCRVPGRLPLGRRPSLSGHRYRQLTTNNHFQQMGWICDMTPGMLEARDDPVIVDDIPPAL